jgi:hypothetical protein
VLYRFAGFDPFQRTSYFGVTLDLGQYERFRRIMYTPYFVSLLNLSDWELISSLEVSSVEDIVGPIAFPHPQQCLPPTFASVLLTGEPAGRSAGVRDAVGGSRACGQRVSQRGSELPVLDGAADRQQV